MAFCGLEAQPEVAGNEHVPRSLLVLTRAIHHELADRLSLANVRDASPARTESTSNPLADAMSSRGNEVVASLWQNFCGTLQPEQAWCTKDHQTAVWKCCNV